jgi:hypothetical protein
VAEFALPLTAEGSVTTPTGVFVFTEPSAESVTFFDIGPATVLELPEFGWAVADGVNPLRLITRGAVYDCGGLAPSTAPTLASSGTRATAVLTFTGASNALARPSVNDTITIGDTSLLVAVRSVTFVDTLTLGVSNEVVRGANADATISNLTKFINGTGTQGTEYWLGTLASPTYDPDYWQNVVGVTVSTSQAYGVPSATTATITFRAVAYGTAPNSYGSTESGGQTSFGSATFTGGTVGTGTAPAAGTYRYFVTWYRDTDGAETGRSPIATLEKGANDNVAISGLTGSADATFDFIRIYRTATLGVEFYLVGAVGSATTTFTDDVDDEALVRGLPWNELLHRAYTEGKPPRGRALALWKGRLWSLGAHRAAEYTRGTVSVTEGSATLTFSVKGVTERMVGRTFQVDGTSEEYTLLSVSESGPTAVADRAYEGATNATATFKIIDAYDASAIRASVPFLFNQWPVSDSPGRVDTDDAEGGVALLATKSRLYAFSKSTIVAVTGDGPESWEISKVHDGVGCVAPRLVVGVEGGGMFLARDGIYAISPDESVVCVSSPRAPKKSVAQGIDGTIARIAWANVDQGYSVYDPVQRVVVFGVPLDGAAVPNYEIVYDLQNGTFTTFKRAEWTDCARAVLPSGGQCLLAGDRDGNLWHEGIGESDGFYGAEAVATLTSTQTVRLLTASGASWSTSGDGEKGKPFVVLYADGVTVAYGKVAANTGTTITPAEDLDTAPAAGDQIVLGAIAWQAKSGYTTFGEEWRSKGLRSVVLRHAPTTRGQYHFAFAVNNGALALCPVGTSIGSLSDTTGKVRHFTQWPGDAHAFSVRGFKPGGRAVLRGGVFDLNLREVGSR